MHNAILFSGLHALLYAIHRPGGDDRIAGDRCYHLAANANQLCCPIRRKENKYLNRKNVK